MIRIIRFQHKMLAQIDAAVWDIAAAYEEGFRIVGQSSDDGWTIVTLVKGH